MVIEHPGSVSFWFDPKKNPHSFKDGYTVYWNNTILNEEKVDIYSEGKTLSAELNRGTDRAVLVFECEIDPDPTKLHNVIFTWSPENGATLYFDGKPLQNVIPEKP